MDYLFLYLLIGLVLTAGFEFLYDWTKKYEPLPQLDFKNRIVLWFFWATVLIIFLKARVDSYKENRDG